MKELKEMKDWTVWINEPKRKVFYKLEPEFKYITQYIDLQVEANYMNVLNLFGEL